MSESNLVRKFEKLVKPVLIIAAFMLLAFFGLSREAKADVSLELGATFLSGEYAQGQVLLLTEQFDRYSVGVGYITKQRVVDRSGTLYNIRENILIQAMRHIRITEKFNMGIGVAYFNGTNRALGSNLEFSLLVRYDFSDRLSMNIRHYSNAGSSPPNMGQDMITFGYTFGGK